MGEMDLDCPLSVLGVAEVLQTKYAFISGKYFELFLKFFLSGPQQDLRKHTYPSMMPKTITATSDLSFNSYFVGEAQF